MMHISWKLKFNTHTDYELPSISHYNIDVWPHLASPSLHTSLPPSLLSLSLSLSLSLFPFPPSLPLTHTRAYILTCSPTLCT